VDWNAPVCPYCGRPGPGKDNAQAAAIIFLLAILAGLFLCPAILVMWPFVGGGIVDVFCIALNSVWAWIGSAAFWSVLGYVVYTKLRESRSNPRQTPHDHSVSHASDPGQSPDWSMPTAALTEFENGNGQTCQENSLQKEEWYYAKDGQQRGPVAVQQLSEWAASGRLLPSDLVWREGLSDWTHAGEIEALFPRLGRGGQVPRPTPPPTQASKHLFHSTALTAPVSPPDIRQSDGTPSLRWRYAKGGEQHGPVSDRRLKELAISGQLSPSDLVWREGMLDWAKAGTIRGLFPKADNR